MAFLPSAEKVSYTGFFFIRQYDRIKNKKGVCTMSLQELVIIRLNNIIKKKGITVNEAAKRSHIPPSTLNNILYGNEENIGVVTLCKLCQGLEMTISEFFGDEMFERK